jgi:sugar lactone lactonase YvrE
MNARQRSSTLALAALLSSTAAAQPLLTYAGGGTDDGKLATSISFQSTKNIVLDAAGNVYVVDGGAGLVRKVDAGSKLISTVAGNGRQGFSGDGAAATLATLRTPTGVVVDAAGNVYVSDTANDRVRRIDASTGLIDTFAGGGNPSDNVGDGGPATAANVAQPWGLALDGKGNLFIAENNGRRVRKVNLASRLISTVAGNGTAGSSGDGGSATSAQLAGPLSVAVDPAGNLFIADAANERIRRVDAQSGAIETFAGNGTHDLADDVPATQTGLFFPDVVALDAAGANLYILDTFHGRVRKVAVASRVITTVAGGGSGGDGGQAKDASIGYYPFGLALDGAGNVYIADGRVRKITTATGVIDTIAGGGTYVGDGGPAKQALLRYPQGLAIDPRSSDLLIVDSFAWRVRDVAKDAHTISTRVGDGSYASSRTPSTRRSTPRGTSTSRSRTAQSWFARTPNRARSRRSPAGAAPRTASATEDRRRTHASTTSAESRWMRRGTSTSANPAATA